MAIVKQIVIEYNKDFPTFLVGEYIEVGIRAYYYDDSSGPLLPILVTTEPECSVISLDIDNFSIEPGFTSSGLKRILPKREGSGIIKAVYESSNGQLHYTSKQFVCYNNFFKTNYLQYLMSSFNASKIQGNAYVKSMFDSMMEMLDVLHAYNEDLKIINNFSQGKSKFLSLLAKNVGFDRIDFTELNTKTELRNDLVFRDLLNNMLGLLSIRGTKLAYELFFGALGYKISIQEFWYDDEGYLVDIDPITPSNSTFLRYNTDGTFVDNPPVPVPDPRSKYIPNNSVFKNNKSNYIRVNLDSTISSDIAMDPNTFSVEKSLIIKKYLEFLRPSHVQYITETTIGGSFSDNTNDLYESISFGKIIELFPSSGTIDKGWISDEVSGFTESFILGLFFPGIIDNLHPLKNDEWSVTVRWDGGGIFDSSIDWDFKEHLTESIEFQKII